MKASNNKFPNHFRGFIVALNENKVEYMLVGGFAMGAYGHIRGTNDLDIFINATTQNAENMIRACVKYGIPQESLNEQMFLVEKMIGIGEPPLRIEILKKLDTVDFSYAYQRISKRNVDGVSINVVSSKDLILMKKAAIKGRNKARDSEDLNFLQKLQSKLFSEEN